MLSLPASTILPVLAYLAIGAHAGTGDHFILTHVPSIAFARIDPIVDPGAMSNHVHNIMGGSNFNRHLNTPAEMLASECSSSIIGDDKSNYWAPLLYYRYENNTYAPMLGQNRIYYFNKDENVKPFPPGLRMISGLSDIRDTDDKRTLGVKISCNHGMQTKFLPNGKTNPAGCTSLSLGIFFPSCGLASGDLDSPDHFSHMAWPQQAHGQEWVDMPNGWKCPESHPIKYPTIFMETNYYLGFGQPWRNDDNLLVLSNGDSVGSTFHADFHNGWDPHVLKDTLQQCGLGKGPGDRLDECAPLKKSADQKAAYSCRYQNEIPAEDVGLMKPISKLPGCNPLWTEQMGDSRPACTSPGNPDFVSPNVAFDNLLYSMHIPLAASWAPEKDSLRDLVPGLGMLGASHIRAWGASEGSNDAKLRVSSVEEINQAAKIGDKYPANNNHHAAPAPAPAQSSSSSTSNSPAPTALSTSNSPAPPPSSPALVETSSQPGGMSSSSATTTSAVPASPTPSLATPGNHLIKEPESSSQTTSSSSSASTTSATGLPPTTTASPKSTGKTCNRRAGAKRNGTKAHDEKVERDEVRRHIRMRRKRAHGA